MGGGERAVQESSAPAEQSKKENKHQLLGISVCPSWLINKPDLASQLIVPFTVLLPDLPTLPVLIRLSSHLLVFIEPALFAKLTPIFISDATR